MTGLFDIPEDLAALKLEKDEPWHFDLIDRDPRDEQARVTAFLGALRKQAPAIAAFAVPNAGRASDWERLKRYREGARAGVPDLVVAWPGGVAFMEWKDGKKPATDQQRDWLNRLHRMGHHCGLFRRPESAIAFLRRAGAPFL